MEEKIHKSTHGYERLDLWQPIVKSGSKFIAVLSDNSIDREDDIMGKSAFQNIIDSDGYTAALIDHENKVLGQVGEWVNKRIEIIDGHSALVAEPKFYESNPQAKIIKGMLEEGAKLGISIGAIPKAHVNKKIGSRTYREYTDIELLEASFVAIPANKHAHALAIAKSLDKKYMEEQKMSKENTDDSVEMIEKKLYEDVLTKSTTLQEKHDSINKAFNEFKESKEAEFTKLNEATETLNKEFEAIKVAKESVDKELSAVQKELTELKESPSFKSPDSGFDETVKNKSIPKGFMPIRNF